MAIKAARTASCSLASHTVSVVVLVDPWLAWGRTEEGCRLPSVDNDSFSTAARFRGFVLTGFFKGKESGVVVGNAGVATPAPSAIYGAGVVAVGAGAASFPAGVVVFVAGTIALAVGNVAGAAWATTVARLPDALAVVADVLEGSRLTLCAGS